MQYRYVAYNATGTKETGSLEATTIEQAKASLKGRRLTVVELAEDKPQTGLNRQIRLGSKKVKNKDVAWIARNLATTQAAGLPVFRAVSMLAAQRAGTPVGEVLHAIETDVAEGKPLGKAFREQEAKLGTLTCALVEAGEATGQLDKSLTRLADMLEGRIRVQRKLRSAMSYPVVMGILAMTLFIAMMLFVAPTFKNIYAELGGDLPPLTKLMLGLSDVMKRFAYLIPLFGIGVVAGYKRGMRNPSFRRRRDALLLRLPVMGNLLEMNVVSRTASTLASTLGAGVPLLDALLLASNVSGNVRFSEALDRARDQVRDGKALHAALSQQDVFPSLFVKIVEIGEETGAVSDLMERYAKTSEEEVETTIEGFTALIEPLLIACLGGLIAIILVSLYLPMFGVVNEIK